MTYRKRNGILVTKAKRAFMIKAALRHMYTYGESSTTQLSTMSKMRSGKLVKDTRFSMSNRKLGALLRKDWRVISKGHDSVSQTTLWDLTDEGILWCEEDQDGVRCIED